MNLEVTISKILSKLKDMYIKYQNTREKIEFTNWNLDVNEHRYSSEDERHIAEALTIESCVLDMCLWYYIYDVNCFDLSTITSSVIFETGKSTRIDLILTQQSQQSQLPTKTEIETQMRDSQIEIELVVVDEKTTNDEKQKNEKREIKAGANQEKDSSTSNKIVEDGDVITSDDDFISPKPLKIRQRKTIENSLRDLEERVDEEIFGNETAHKSYTDLLNDSDEEFPLEMSPYLSTAEKSTARNSTAEKSTARNSTAAFPVLYIRNTSPVPLYFRNTFSILYFRKSFPALYFRKAFPALYFRKKIPVLHS